MSAIGVDRPFRALLIVPRFRQHSFYNAKETCRIAGRKYTAMQLGLLTVAALLPQEWEFKYVDMNAYDLDESLIEWADLVLTGGMLTQEPEMRWIISRAHAHGKPAAVGGPDPTHRPELYAEAEWLVLDEGEVTIPPFVEALKRGDKGGTFRSGGEKPDMSLVPPPRYDLVDPGDYLYACVQYSRGCPFDCEFCDIIELYGRKSRVKSPEQFCAELQALYDAGHRGHVGIVDDNLIGDKKGVKVMLRYLRDWLEARDWPFYFSTQLTLTLAHDEELLRLLADVDFRTVYIGIETPEPDVLAITNKKHNVLKPILESVKKIYEAGIMVHSGFLFGFDGESPNTSLAHKTCIEELGIIIAGCGLLVALPGTQLERRLRKQGRLLVRAPGADSWGEGKKYDQITQGLNYTPHRPRLTILKEFRDLRAHLFTPAAYFKRVRTFISLFKPHPVKHKPSLWSLPKFARMYLHGLAVVAGRPAMWWETAKTIAYGTTKGLSGVVTACAMTVYYLHLGPQTEHVVADLDEHIREIESLGEDAYNRRRHLVIAEPPKDEASARPASSTS